MSTPRRSSPPEGPWAELAAALSERRHQLGLTQREAADLSDLSEKALRDIESGRTAPRLGALVALADALGLDLMLQPRGVGPSDEAAPLRIRRGGAA